MSTSWEHQHQLHQAASRPTGARGSISTNCKQHQLQAAPAASAPAGSINRQHQHQLHAIGSTRLQASSSTSYTSTGCKHSAAPLASISTSCTTRCFSPNVAIGSLRRPACWAVRGLLSGQ